MRISFIVVTILLLGAQNAYAEEPDCPRGFERLSEEDSGPTSMTRCVMITDPARCEPIDPLICTQGLDFFVHSQMHACLRGIRAQNERCEAAKNLTHARVRAAVACDLGTARDCLTAQRNVQNAHVRARTIFKTIKP